MIGLLLILRRHLGLLLTLLILLPNPAANIIGVKKYGGSKAGMWGSTIGLLVGPFVIPIIGILIGPFLGAALAELLVNKKNLNEAVKVGFGSVVGFVSSVVTKGSIMTIMLVYFFILV